MKWVSYLGLKSHESHGSAIRLFRPDMYGGMLSFGVKGDAEAGSQVVDNLKLASHLVNIGSYLFVDDVHISGEERLLD